MTNGFFKVDNMVFDYKLRPITFLVYCYLIRCDNAKNGCFPSKATIAKNCSIAQSSVDKALYELVGNGKRADLRVNTDEGDKPTRG